MSWKHFKIEEFNCPDCGLNAIDPALVDILDAVRDEIDYVMSVDSGTRCPQHNANVGGKRDSEHLVQADGLSHAADIACADDHMRFLLIKKLLEKGITRIEDGVDWIHAGNSPYHPPEVIFHA
jgi:hypothetical protein